MILTEHFIVVELPSGEDLYFRIWARSRRHARRCLFVAWGMYYPRIPRRFTSIRIEYSSWYRSREAFYDEERTVHSGSPEFWAEDKRKPDHV